MVRKLLAAITALSFITTAYAQQDPHYSFFMFNQVSYNPAYSGTEGMISLMNAVRECGYLFGIHDQYRDYYYDTAFFTFDEARQNLDGSHSHNHIWAGGHYAYLCAQKAVGYVRQN